jgi:hypothetical protein
MLGHYSGNLLVKIHKSFLDAGWILAGMTKGNLSTRFCDAVRRVFALNISDIKSFLQPWKKGEICAIRYRGERNH